MSSVVPLCKTINVFAFRGNLSRANATAFLKLLDNAKNGHGPDPSGIDCLLFLGHTGVLIDGGATIYGFNPFAGPVPIWQMLNSLRNGDAFPGTVRDDTGVFAAARISGAANQINRRDFAGTTI